MIVIKYAEDGKTDVGFVMNRIERANSDGLLHSNGEGFYFDPSLPQSAAATFETLKFVYTQLSPSLGIRTESILADHFGRYFYALLGFDFSNRSGRGGFYDSSASLSTGEASKNLTTAELMRRNLARFLRRNGIDYHDLLKRSSEGESTPLQSLDQLVRPIDFVTLRHRQDLKISISPLRPDLSVGGLQSYSVGQAFALANLNPKLGQPTVRSVGNSVFSAEAMPRWYGVKTF